jgi:hypothetical protein
MDICTSVQLLPHELINLIQEYIPKKEFIFTNRENYKLYHSEIHISIQKYDSFIKNIIKRDNDFVFNVIIHQDYNKWLEIKDVIYKNMTFNSYIHFIINYCIENESDNCKRVLLDFLKEHGLCKNLHKKNIVKYIRWTT